MGSNFYKSKNECNCGEDYGTCNYTNTFVLEYARSCDIWILYLKKHSEKKGSIFKPIGWFTDEDIASIRSILNGQTIEITSEDLIEISNANNNRLKDIK